MVKRSQLAGGAFMEGTVPIFLFTGTNNTLRAAEELQTQGRPAGMEFSPEVIGESWEAHRELTADLFLIMSPIYGGGLPRKIYRWVGTLPPGEGKLCALILTGAGGEHKINSGAGGKLERLLKKKSYRLFYTRILAMPSNWYIATPDPLKKALWAILPEKCHNIILHLKEGKERVIRRKSLLEKIIEVVAWLEDQQGARFWGRFLRAGDQCTGCGKCVRECPMGNIRKDGKGAIRFGWSCVFCMKCVYSCPARAIQPRFMKSVVLKEGFDMSAPGKDVPMAGEGITDFGSFKYLEKYFTDMEA